jgi:glucose-6-phosphate-specific signal transduction histidine kinase
MKAMAQYGVKALAKYIPGMIIAVVVAAFFQRESAQGMILAVVFAFLATTVIALGAEIYRLNTKIEEVRKELAERIIETDTTVHELARETGDTLGQLSGAMIEDLNALSDNLTAVFDNEIHELALLIADQKYGEED